MTVDAGSAMKARMRADLREAMKGGRADEARLIRDLIAALDNAEAPPLPVENSVVQQHQFQAGSAEVERLWLDASDVRAILFREIEERESAAAEFSRLARHDHAAALRNQAAMARRYVE